MKVDIRKARITIDSDLYEITNDEGDIVVDTELVVVAEFKNGKRLANNTTFGFIGEGAVVAMQRADLLVRKVSGRGWIDDQFWSERHPVYGSGYYQAKDDAKPWPLQSNGDWQ